AGQGQVSLGLWAGTSEGAEGAAVLERPQPFAAVSGPGPQRRVGPAGEDDRCRTVADGNARDLTEVAFHRELRTDRLGWLDDNFRHPRPDADRVLLIDQAFGAQALAVLDSQDRVEVLDRVAAVLVDDLDVPRDGAMNFVLAEDGDRLNQFLLGLDHGGTL